MKKEIKIKYYGADDVDDRLILERGQMVEHWWVRCGDESFTVFNKKAVLETVEHLLELDEEDTNKTTDLDFKRDMYAKIIDNTNRIRELQDKECHCIECQRRYEETGD